MPKSEYIEYFYFETVIRLMALDFFKEERLDHIKDQLAEYPVSAVDDELLEVDKNTYCINSVIAIKEVGEQTLRSGVLRPEGEKYVKQMIREACRLWKEYDLGSIQWETEELEYVGIAF